MPAVLVSNVSGRVMRTWAHPSVVHAAWEATDVHSGLASFHVAISESAQPPQLGEMTLLPGLPVLGATWPLAEGAELRNGVTYRMHVCAMDQVGLSICTTFEFVVDLTPCSSKEPFWKISLWGHLAKFWTATLNLDVFRSLFFILVLPTF